MVSPGEAGFGEPRSEPNVEGKGLAFVEGGIRSAQAGGPEFLVTSGGSVRASPGAERIVGAFALALGS